MNQKTKEKLLPYKKGVDNILNAEGYVIGYKQPKQRRATIKQKKFIDKVVELGNATEAAAQIYKCKNRVVAGSIGTENLQKPLIVQGIEERLKIAKDKIFYLAQYAEKEEVQYKASQDIIDRVEGKPTQKVITEGSLNMKLDVKSMSTDELLEYVKKNLKK